jgi:hypothetical protein
VGAVTRKSDRGGATPTRRTFLSAVAGAAALPLSGTPGDTDRGDARRAEARIAAVRRRQKPVNEIPVSVPLDLLLGRTDDIAVAITGARVYANGVECTLALRARSARRHGRQFHEMAGTMTRADQPDRLLLGFEYADGRTVTSLGDWSAYLAADAFDDTPTLTWGGGGASGCVADYQFFLAPIPPPGDLVVMCAWPAFELPESRAVVDATPITEMARRPTVLWPEPSEPPAGVDMAPPDLPAGSWFSGAAGRSEHGRS